jgi:hypothetical protein
MPGFRYFSWKADGLFEEVDPHQSGLATLPGDRNPGAAMGLDELSDIGFQHFVAHAKVTAGIET